MSRLPASASVGSLGPVLDQGYLASSAACAMATAMAVKPKKKCEAMTNEELLDELLDDAVYASMFAVQPHGVLESVSELRAQVLARMSTIKVVAQVLPVDEEDERIVGRLWPDGWEFAAEQNCATAFVENTGAYVYVDIANQKMDIRASTVPIAVIRYLLALVEET